MPTNRNKRKRIQEGIRLDESIETFFLTGTALPKTAGEDLKLSRFFSDSQEIKDAWKQHREYLLEKWKQEKRRGLPWVVDYLKLKGE